MRIREDNYGPRHVRWHPQSSFQDEIPDNRHLNLRAIEHVLYCRQCQSRISTQEDFVEKQEAM